MPDCWSCLLPQRPQTAGSWGRCSVCKGRFWEGFLQKHQQKMNTYNRSQGMDNRLNMLFNQVRARQYLYCPGRRLFRIMMLCDSREHVAVQTLAYIHTLLHTSHTHVICPHITHASKKKQSPYIKKYNRVSIQEGTIIAWRRLSHDTTVSGSLMFFFNEKKKILGLCDTHADSAWLGRNLPFLHSFCCRMNFVFCLQSCDWLRVSAKWRQFV
jgi:hypothetical protein